MSEHHWRLEFESKYLGSQHFTGNTDKVLTIQKVQPENLTSTDGQTSRHLVAHWAEDQLPMVLNKTNCRTIAKLLKENDYTKWAGARIQIYVDKNVKAFGETVEGLRIRKTLPKAARIQCEGCGQMIAPAFGMAISDLAAYTKEKYGRALCADCATKAKGENANAADSNK